ncbi:hypothetical protein GCM10027052_22240 [Parafrigoribacterium mesophilum]|uniref:DUF3566 domain-containing protein n=1 Tax=Parafrigoribacterium mesophilum TaxID=433646 RepID=UPI0031FDD527
MSSVAEKLQRKSQRAVQTKQVRLKLVYIDFWSVVKLAFLVTVCLGIVMIVATFLVWMFLDSTSIFDKINSLLQSILDEPGFDVMSSFSLVKVMLFTSIVALLNVVVGTVLGALVAVLYNFTVRITGGVLVGFTNN